MRTATTLFTSLLMLLALPAVQAADARPTEQSVRELLSVMQAHNMIDTMRTQMDATWGPMLKQAMGSQKLNAREQQIADEARARIQALYGEQLKWESFEPMMIAIYQNSFSQKDIDGMKAFYSSPTGQAVIAKMPIVLQQTLRSMQERMADLIPKIRQIQMDMQAQLKAEREAQGSATESQPGAAPSPTRQ